jgi:hypothetical protein
MAATKTKKAAKESAAAKATGAKLSQSARLRSAVTAWHGMCYGMLEEMNQVACDLLGELKRDKSPLRELGMHQEDLRELVDALGQGLCSMLNLYMPSFSAESSSVPNPLDVIYGK